MPWIDNDDGFNYRFLRSGDLEFRDRTGQYRVVAGVSPDGYFDFWDRFEEVKAIIEDSPSNATLGELYLAHGRFQFVIKECLRLSGIDPEWVGLSQITWLLLARRNGDQVIEPPLERLNRLPSPRRPVGAGGEPVYDKVGFLTAIASHCNGDLDAAYRIATSRPAREVMAVMEEKSWHSKTVEQQQKAEIEDAKRQVRAERAKARGR